MMRLAPIAMLILLTGCTAEYEAFAAAGAVAAARMADNQLRASEHIWCNAASSGAEKRLYGAIKPLWKARMRVCWPELVE